MSDAEQAFREVDGMPHRADMFTFGHLAVLLSRGEVEELGFIQCFCFAAPQRFYCVGLCQDVFADGE